MIFAKLSAVTKLNAMVALLVAALLSTSLYALYALDQAQARGNASLQLAREAGAAAASARAVEAAFESQDQAFEQVLRGPTAPDHERHVAALRTQGELINRQLDELKAAVVRLGLPSSGVEQAIRMQAQAVQQYGARLKEADPARVDAAGAVSGEKRPALGEKMREIADGLGTFTQAETAKLAEAASGQWTRTALVFAIVAGLATLLSVMLRLAIRDGILRSIRAAAQVVSRVAEGDLTVRVGVSSHGETQKMLQGLEDMTVDLRKLVGEVARSAHAVADTSGQIAQGNLDLSQRTEEQASTLEETASSMEELTSTVAHNADSARKASQLASGASDVARKAGQVVDQVVATMDDISDASKKISDIIGVIDGIAFQTNILALNAAVEAARAGEQGRGFAVVAAEVRSLAQRSAAAAREIKTLIGESVKKVEAGGSLVDAAGHTMVEVVSSVQKVSELIAEIAAASQEQSSGIGQVNTAMTQMEQVVQQNASLVEEATAATESMKEQANSLLQLVSRFNLGEQQSQFTPVQHPVSPPPLAPIKVRPSTKLAPAYKAALGTSSPKPSRNGEWEEF
jgi:methyl-accepting chemotaxis protein